jgi:sporulation protein YlmC with PRC-barrel domain
MSRTLVVLAAVSALMSTALAQAPPTSSPAPAAPAASAASSTSQVVPAQSADEWLASKLKGTTVIGSDDQRVGDISDVLFDKTGNVKAFIVGIGGVLGIGAKQVALDMKVFQEMPATEGKSQQFKLSMTTDQLKQMAEFKPMPASPTTTGLAPAAPRPAGNLRPPAPDNK